MSPSAFLPTRTRVLLIFPICAVALASFWVTSQRAKSRFNQPTSHSVSTGLFLPDKRVITPEATITVNSLSDVANSNDGLCTLREALTAANNNAASGAMAGECAAGSNIGSDTISFSLSGTINLTDALPNISSAMSVNGPGSGQLTVRRDTGGNYRIFTISSGTVSISGMTITNGRPPDAPPNQVNSSAPPGGGILQMAGTLTLNDLVVTGNLTGIGSDNSSSSTGFGGTGGTGAGIHIMGTAVITNCIVSNNTTGNGGLGGVNGSSGPGGYGGGMFFDNNATATLQNVTVTGNRTGTGPGPNGGSGSGGGIWSGGGGFQTTTVLNMINVSITNNATSDGQRDSGAGGGLAIISGNVTLTNCTVANNHTGNGSANGQAGRGGGISNFGNLTIVGSTVVGNSTGSAGSFATNSGGGIASETMLTMINSTVSGNSTGTGAPTQGGGIYSNNILNLINCTVTENTVPTNTHNGITVGHKVNLRNTILARNGAGGNGPDITSSIFAPIELTSQGHNLIGNPGSVTGFTAPGDQVGVNPNLGPLANNGGPTFTHALLTNSPALDAGDNCVTEVAHCGDTNIPQLNSDQRTFNRRVDGPDADTTATVDIGAYETQGPLANLPDTSTNEDTQLFVGFEPGDPGTVTSITATSSNTTLVPNDVAHLSAALSGVTGVVTINPAADRFGTTNITITVNRTAGSENKTFLLTVVPINEVPSFTKGADQTVNEDAGAQTVNGWAANISPGPGDESGQVLTFQITDNTNAALFSAGPAISSTGVLTYTPAANANGASTITINLKDDGGTANGGVDTSPVQTFIINVNSVNDPPSFTKGADQTVNNNAGSQTVTNWATNLSRGASNETGQSLSFQVTANSNPGLFLNAPAINVVGTLSYSPLANVGGTATITVVLKDTGGTANGGVDTSAPQSFNITITPVGGVINFSASTNDTTESSGFTTVTVKRTGDLSRAVTVDYASSGDNGLPCSTASGVATPKCDFTSALGTLNFAAGEDTKTVDILISQDTFVEGPETFSMTLSNQTGNSALGPSSTASTTIADDVTELLTNPIDDVRNFVRQHYHDFLSREPDASGWDFWTNQITSCGGDAACNEVRRIDVSASFFLSIEFQQNGYLVERFYKVAYANGQGSSTLNGQHTLGVPIVRYSEFMKDTQRIGRGVVVLAPGWEQALESNKVAYAMEFVQTTRFTTQFPSTMNPTSFVDQINGRAGSVLSASERQTVINVFGGATTISNVTARAQAVRMVAEDQDLYNFEFNRAFVLAQYFGYLRRNPNDAPDSDYTGYDFWLTKLNQFNGNYINAEMVKAFLSSIEYRQRFGP